ncbi:MAG: thioesterase family protein [Acidobacteriota bacterium]|nr:thioesterase family protein [Acidobacteriota bacterium]MDE3107309.1 thioesterase family protein [Acidobacteriota bacterium]
MPDDNDAKVLRVAASVEPLDEGRYRAQLSEVYTVMGHPHGGYLQSVLANAALAGASEADATHLHAGAVTTNYFGASVPGEADLAVTVRRVGRGASFAHVVLTQEQRPVVESLVVLVTLDDGDAPRYQDAVAPILPPREECVASTGGSELSIASVLEQRLDPSTAAWRDGVVHERGETRAWLRLDDGEGRWDPWNLHFAADAMPPATFPLGSTGWVPTLQLSSYVRRVPVGEWLQARQWCVVIAGDLVDERLELFDERGQLVASSSQLAMVRFPQRERP